MNDLNVLAVGVAAVAAFTEGEMRFVVVEAGEKDGNQSHDKGPARASAFDEPSFLNLFPGWGGTTRELMEEEPVVLRHRQGEEGRQYPLHQDRSAQPRSAGPLDPEFAAAMGKGGELFILDMGEPVEIAIAAGEKLLDSRRHALQRGTNEIRLVVDSPPSSVTVDPGITRIDRNPLDNVKRF